MEPEEGEDGELAKRAEYAIWRRLRRQWDMIAEWRAKRHVFAAFFGRDGLEPFDEMESVLRRLRASIEALLEQRDDGREDKEFIISMRRNVYRHSKDEDDKIGQDVNAAVKKVEKICLPVIRERAN